MTTHGQLWCMRHPTHRPCLFSQNVLMDSTLPRTSKKNRDEGWGTSTYPKNLATSFMKEKNVTSQLVLSYSSVLHFHPGSHLSHCEGHSISDPRELVIHILNDVFSSWKAVSGVPGTESKWRLLNLLGPPLLPLIEDHISTIPPSQDIQGEVGRSIQERYIWMAWILYIAYPQGAVGKQRLSWPCPATSCNIFWSRRAKIFSTG